ncbi:MAG: PhzF family phenazine biosynthesis isomerase [Acidimicrobiia bacterium]
MTTIRRYAAFTDRPDGGNPAGVWVGEQLPNLHDMQTIAADIGYSETVFAGSLGEREYRVRYFSPIIEVPFCGHATIALGVALGPAAEGGYSLETPAGRVKLTVTDSPAGPVAALTSVEPTHSPARPTLVAEVIRLLGWDLADLDDSIQPAIANAGANHLVISVKKRHTLQRLSQSSTWM